MERYAELIQALPTAEDRPALWQELEQEMRENGTLAGFLNADTLLAEADWPDIQAKPLRLFFLRSWTLEQMVLVLRAKARLQSIRLQCEVGGFNQYQQEILDPGSALYRHDPQVVVLAVRLEEIAPELVHDFPALSPEAVREAADRVLQTYRSLLEVLQGRIGAAVLVHNFAVPARPATGILDSQQPDGQAATIRRLNQSLVELCRTVPGTAVVDIDGLAARCGKANWVDQRMLYMASIAVNPQFLPHLADEHLGYLVHLAGLTRKCLVLDLDNTLWGGVVGEDGPQSIRLGTDYPGAAFVAFQRAILQLYGRGVILALCSKNNPEDALEVVENHPHMLLRREHFAAMRINWQEKATNLREIARELNIGLDSLVFLDDNPVEVARVRRQAPEVLAYQIPPQPERYAAFLAGLPVFEVLSLTDEDRRRGEEYRQQTLRRSLEESSPSLAEFYRKLEMRATIAPASPATLPRIAQLTQKTNQFNLTTRRFTEQEVQSRIASGEWLVFGLELEDRYGKNGLVAVAILRPAGEEMWIDTFLMSCRVMSRTVEQTFLQQLAVIARQQGRSRLIGEYIPTAKNGMVADFYSSCGFAQVEQGERGSVWALNLSDLSLEPSPFIAVTCREENLTWA